MVIKFFVFGTPKEISSHLTNIDKCSVSSMLTTNKKAVVDDQKLQLLKKSYL